MVNVVLLLINGHIKDINIPLDSKSTQKTFDKLYYVEEDENS